MPRARLAPCARPRWCLHHRTNYEGEDFVVICTNRAVLDVGLLSLHDLRADSLIRPIASRSVIQLLSNHCHFNNHIFSAYFFYLGPNPRARSELQWQCNYCNHDCINIRTCNHPSL